MFVNVGAPMKIVSPDENSNEIVMNTIIASASSGLIQAIIEQYNNNIQSQERARQIH